LSPESNSSSITYQVIFEVIADILPSGWLRSQSKA